MWRTPAETMVGGWGHWQLGTLAAGDVGGCGIRMVSVGGIWGVWGICTWVVFDWVASSSRSKQAALLTEVVGGGGCGSG